jgi:hypothetical protein
MKHFLLPGALALACIASAGADANPTEASDFEIISVVPRSPDVKPAFMSVPANGRREASAHAKAAPAPEKLASANTQDSAATPGASKK